MGIIDKFKDLDRKRKVITILLVFGSVVSTWAWILIICEAFN